MSRAFDLLKTSMWWLDHGVSVVPVLTRSKVCMLRWRSYEVRKPTINELRAWFRAGDNNLAVVCGTGNLLVIDFDDLSQFTSFKTKAGTLSSTYTEYTGRGAHLFYQVDDAKTERFIECESLGLGHLCMVAPSVHPSGKVYRPDINLKDILQVKTSELFSLLSKPIVDNYFPLAPGKSRIAPIGGSLVDQIKVAIDLLTFAQSITQLKPSGGDGRWWIGKCPLHEDTSPSLWIDSERNTWGCYSPSCPGHRGGDVINLYALINRLTVSESIRALAQAVER